MAAGLRYASAALGSELQPDLAVAVGGQEAPPVGVHVGEHLLGHGHAEGDPEPRPCHRTSDGERDQSHPESGDEPPAVGLVAPAETEPPRDEKSGDDACQAGVGPVEVGAQDEQPAPDDTGPTGSLEHSEEREEARDRERRTPDEVLVEDERRGGQVDEDRPAADGGEKDAIGRGLGPPEQGRTSGEDPHAPDEQGAEHRGQDPRQQHRGRGKARVETARQGEDRQPEQRGEQAEIRVGPVVMDEAFDAQRPVGQIQVAVEDGPGLEIVEIALVRLFSQEVRLAGPQVPKDPEKRHAGHRDSYHRRDGEAAQARIGPLGPLATRAPGSLERRRGPAREAPPHHGRA